MPIDALQQKKEELAMIYLADLKKELGTLQGKVVDILSDRLKAWMTSETSLTDIDDLKLTAAEKQLAALSPVTAEKIFAFVKEKQEKLASATTVEELENLKEEMQSTTAETGTTTRNLTASGIMIGAGLTGWGTGEAIKRAKIAEKMSETITASKTRESMDGIVKVLKLKAQDGELLPVQKVNIEKSITYFEDASKNASCMDAVKIWKKLGNKLSIDVFNSLVISEDAAKDLAVISKDNDLLKLLAKEKDATEINKLLKGKGLNTISDDVVKLIKAAESVEDISDITKVLSVAKPIKALAKGLRMIPYLDLIGGVVDFWIFTQESGQSDFIKKANELRAKNQQQRANFHLATGAASFAAGCAGVALGASAFGPPGWIVSVAAGVVGALSVAANTVADAYYYDVVDFYLRNKEDYKPLYRNEIKQAILQATVRGDKSFTLSGTESFAEFFNRSDSIDKNKAVTLEDAYRAVVYLEEIEDFPYIKKYNPEYPKTSTVTLTGDELTEYTKERAELDTVLSKRMEYIKRFLPSTTTADHTTQYTAFITGIKNTDGISSIEKVIADSKTYQTMSVDEEVKGYTDIDAYAKARAERLKTVNATCFTALEKLYAEDQNQIVEMYYNVLNFEFSLKDNESYKEKYVTLLPNISFLKQYYTYKNLGVSLEKQKSVGSISDISYVATEEFLENMDAGTIELKPTVFTEELLKNRSVAGSDLDRFDDSSAEYSSSVGQNVIYRIAKEIYGYTGNNDLMSLIMYFTPDKKASLGMYYDDGWYININGRRNDKKITFADIETLSVVQLMLLFTKKIGTSIAGTPEIKNAENITTATENADEALNAEFQEKIKTILTEEKGYQTKEMKDGIETDIVDYIKKYGTEGYIKLPFYLINKAKRAGIGDVEYFYFTYKDNAITTCSTKAYVDEKLDFTSVTINKSYIENARDALSENEQKYITYVEEPYKRLIELRNIEGVFTHEDELDLPQEFESQIGDKYKEWERFKETLLSYDPGICKEELVAHYQEYHDYFENLYLAILNELSTRKVSNDIDGYAYLMSVVGKMQGGFFDVENKKLLEGVLSEDDAKTFYASVASNKLSGKTITELAMSTDMEEQKKGLRGAKQVLRSILEAKTLTIDGKTGKITDIRRGFDSKSTVSYTVRTAYAKLLAYNLDETKYIALPDFATATITSKTAEELTVKTLAATEKKTYAVAETTVKAIERMLPNVVRQDQRGKIIYDDQKNLLTSRSKSIEIDPTTLKIKGLDIVFKDLQELLYAANLVNRFKYKYPGVKDFYFGSRAWTQMDRGIYRPKSGLDTQILDLDTIKAKFPSLLDSNNDIKKSFIMLINTA